MSGPITIVKSGYDVQSATGTNILLNSDYPFTKLDTQNIVSFQTISLLFNREPTQPPGTAPYYANTLIYQFPHGYNYVPSPWLMWQNSDPEFPPSPGNGNTATTFYPFGDDTSGGDAITIMNSSGSLNANSYLALESYGEQGTSVQVTSALLFATADVTNVYIYIMKVCLGTLSGSIFPLYLAGVTLNIRCYVFCEPSTTSTY